MSSIRTRKQLATKHLFAGRQWYYTFRKLRSVFPERECLGVANKLLKRYSLLTKVWGRELNSEWTCRLFLSAKLIMTSTLQLNALAFAEERNLRVVTPYLRYYSILSLLRAICYTLPEHVWANGDLIQMSHAAAIRGAIEHLRRFDVPTSQLVEKQLRELKAERELISYRAVSSGDIQVSPKDHLHSLATLLAEVAQFNSELLEASFTKNANSAAFDILEDDVERIVSVDIEGHCFVDWEDALRLSYLARRNPFPANIQHLMTEGHAESFFGAWHAGEDGDELFDPDNNFDLIFDIP